MTTLRSFWRAVRSALGLSLIVTAARRTSRWPVGEEPPSTKTCVTSGMVAQRIDDLVGGDAGVLQRRARRQLDARRRRARCPRRG